MTEPQSEADRDQPYKYRALESPLHIRLIHLLPGKPDEDIRLRISHELLRQPEQPRSLRLSRKHLQRTLPPGWDVVETIEGRFIFMNEPDDASSEENEESDEGSGIVHTWKHPDPTIDPELYELPPVNPAKPVFEALSYVWGRQCDPVVATIEGEAGEYLGNIKLGKNLGKALRHLRYQDKERMLWVDAICINQNDDVERATQVLRMSSIYQDCSRVIIWLGPEKHEIGLVFSELAHIGSQVEKTTNGFIMSSPDTTDFRWWKDDVPVSFSDEVWSAIKKLGDRSWFHRLWTVQEAIMANRDSIIQSGDAIISWALFRRAVACLLHKNEMPMARVSISAMRSIAKNPIGATLAHTLDAYQARLCSDFHDKIYGLLAILPPRFASEIKPDYEQPVVELYKSCFLANIKALSRWELRGCPRNPDEDDCPSWVPDLSQVDPYGRRVSEHYASGCSALHHEYQAPNLLKVVGLRFDTVKSVSEKTFDHWDDGETAIRSIRSWEPECSLTDPYPSGGTYLDAFAATFLQDGRVERRPTEGFTLEHIKDRFETEFLSTASTPVSKLSRGDMMEYVIWTRSKGRAMVTTERGSIGLACTFAQPGDVICVVLGCDFPVLLRPSEDNTWKFLSDCYVWDLEATQGLLGPLPSLWQAQLFYDPVTEHRSYTRYHNPETGELTAEDPRLEPLVGWQRVSVEELGRDLTGDDPEVYDFFRNMEDGRIVNSDPSRGCTYEALIDHVGNSASAGRIPRILPRIGLDPSSSDSLHFPQQSSKMIFKVLAASLFGIACAAKDGSQYPLSYGEAWAGPVRFADNFNLSSNSTGFTMAEATLVMPHLSIPKKPHKEVDEYTASFWIGLDGVLSSDIVRGLWQAGVIMSVWPNGTTKYTGFHEWIPDDPIDVSSSKLAISEGDHIHVVLMTTNNGYHGSTTLTNLNTSRTYTHSQNAANLWRGPTFPAQGATAEW
ncbi:Heterokaryon incompatibility [Fusarium oxysporum f. sp. vasinfectum]|nr:Heterokaryon incompatibility [Fusarium oxysporum f. sp. vasinfectum]KAK2933173.1 Heterokaryon incompatibility [Fusarium oxysporum f. sp. vasinfectum]